MWANRGAAVPAKATVRNGLLLLIIDYKEKQYACVSYNVD
jgi:hypothetical protein